MQPKFNSRWEHTNTLICREYQNDTCNLQFHAQIELYFVDEGEMDLQVGGRQALLKEGQFSVALEYVTHAYKTPVSSRSSVLLIPPHLCKQFLTLVEGKRPRSPFITNRAVYDRIRPYYELLKQTRDNPLLQQGYLNVILGILYDCIPFETGAIPNADLTTRILTCIEHHFTEDLTPSSVAETLGYSHSYLARFFKEHFGITLGQYLSAVKLKHALSLMLEEKVSVTDCALESGFSSVNSFYRAFSKEFGCSPSAYMKKIHQ